MDWGRITVQTGKLYLHVFDWPKDDEVLVPMKLSGTIKAFMLADGSHQPLQVKTGTDGVRVVLKPRFQNPYASVVVLEGAWSPR